MKNKKYKPYNIDIRYELETYKNVGKDYGNRKTSDLGWILNLKRWRRKRKNRNEEQYKFCNKFSEWEKHVQNILPTHILNYDDMLHWLFEKKVYAENMLIGIKSVLIPIYVALLPLYEIFSKEKEAWQAYIIICVLTGVIIKISISALFNARNEVEFYKDLIEIVKSIKY